MPLPRAHHSAWATLVLHAIAVAVVTVMTPGVSAEEEAGEEDHGDAEHHEARNINSGGRVLREEPGIALADAAHWATEWPWLADAERRITAVLPLETRVSTVVTDAWDRVYASSEGVK